MKTSLSLFILVSLAALSGCGDDDGGTTGTGGAGGEAGEAPTSGGSAGEGGSGGSTTVGGGGEGGEPVVGEGGTGGVPTTGGIGGEAGEGGAPASGGGGEGGVPATGGIGGVGGAGGEGGASEPDPQPFYACQGTDQAFVRRAIQGVLGRRAYSQAEVNMYTDLIAEIDALDGVDPSVPAAIPGEPLRHSRKVFLNVLFQNPEYQSNWEELYRDFLRVQRVDEYQNAPCYGLRARVADPVAVATYIRDNAPDSTGDGGLPPTMADVVTGSIMLDDISPMYTANLFGMVVKTYSGANGVEIESEVGRRRDFGAWFDAVYLNRDTVCLQCHNSEFSVTQTSNPETNRHYPIPALLEKALFGVSTGVVTPTGVEPVDAMHGALKFARFVSTCGVQTEKNLNATTGAITDNNTFLTAVNNGLVTPGSCPPGANPALGGAYRLCTTAGSLGPRDWMCEATYQATRATRPWNLAAACGTFTARNSIPVDLANIDTKFGVVTGKRSSMWDMHDSLRRGFNKLKAEGLGADPVTREVSDPDKAFAYLTAMNIVEKVWKEIVGTGLTIQTYFPRNAASRDQLQLLTDTFIASGYSHKALLEEIFASPYVNPASPDSGCQENAYDMPRIYDPWVTAEEDPVKRGNSAGDAVIMLGGRTAARAAYAGLGWRLAAWGSAFPGATGNNGYGENPVGTSATLERQFQGEVGYFNKNTELGFRGFDFQARMGWEDRLGRCAKLAPNAGAADIIDNLVTSTSSPGVGTAGEVVEVLKDRLTGESLIDVTAEKAALETILGVSLDADASTIPNANTTLRRVCGALVATPQALLTGIVAPDASAVPRLTPGSAKYSTLCSKLATTSLIDGLAVSCNGDDSLTVTVESEP